MSISENPDQIRRDIERTRAHLSSEVDALADKVTPGRIVERRVGGPSGRRPAPGPRDGRDDPTSSPTAPA